MVQHRASMPEGRGEVWEDGMEPMRASGAPILCAAVAWAWLLPACGISKPRTLPEPGAGGSSGDAVSPANRDAAVDEVARRDAGVDEASDEATGGTRTDGGAEEPDRRGNNGAVCVVAADCVSGFCVDGVCCNTACSGPCRACAVTPVRGYCVLLAAGAPPRAPTECPASTVSTCGLTGRCDGNGGCQKAAAGTVCGPAICRDNMANQGQSACDGAGTCVAPAPIRCDPYRCDPVRGMCLAECDSDADCVLGRCMNRACLPRIETGCTFASECPSGFCAQGVCCDSACAGACRACNLAGRIGMCTVIPSGRDPQGYCAVQDPATCGTNGNCDSQGACARYADGTTCGTGRTCTAGICQ